VALLVAAGDGEGDFNTLLFGVLVGSKGTLAWLATPTRELRSLFLNSATHTHVTQPLSISSNITMIYRFDDSLRILELHKH